MRDPGSPSTRTSAAGNGNGDGMRLGATVTLADQPVTLASTLAALFGYLFLAGASGDVVAAIQAFAAGAILTMLASTMMPEAYEEGGPVVGVVTTVGFLVAFVLSRVA